MKTQFDEVDLQLLDLLQSNGRMTNAELAKRVSLSPPSVLQRVRALEQSGLIRSYRAVLDPERMGLKLTAWVMVTLSLHQERAIESFRKAVLDVPEVLECYNVSGDFDFLLKVLVRDMRGYENLIRKKLSKLPGVNQIRSSFVIDINKIESRLPL